MCRLEGKLTMPFPGHLQVHRCVRDQPTRPSILASTVVVFLANPILEIEFK